MTDEPFKRANYKRPRIAPSEQTVYVPLRMWRSNVDFVTMKLMPIDKGNRSRSVNYAIAYAEMAVESGIDIHEVVNKAKRAKWWEKRKLAAK